MYIQSALGNTQALLEVAIAFCIAYIALERFRYSKIIKTILEDSIGSATKVLNSCNAQRDSSLTQLRQLQQQIGNNEFGVLGYSLIFNPRPRFSSYSLDQILVISLNIILIFLLFQASLFPQNNSLRELGYVFGFSFVGIVAPTFFIYVGNHNIRYANTETHKYISRINSTYSQNDPESGYSAEIAKDAIEIKQKTDQFKESSSTRLWPNP